jgi:hypothetical protein
MKAPFHLLTPITDFRKLGTGHKRRTFVAVTADYRILFIARILHNNLQTSRTVTFDNRKVFHTDTETINVQKVRLFSPCGALREEWARQNESDRIAEWMQSAAPQDVFTFLDCVAMERELTQPKYSHEFMREIAKKEIRAHLEFLSLPELRRLTSIIGFGESGQAA